MSERREGDTGRSGEQMINERQNECSICSFLQNNAPVYHRHFSSLYHRQISGAEDSPEPYHCPSCMRTHEPYHGPRLKIAVTDSTLHQFYAPPGHTGAEQYQGDNVHVDYLTIASAEIRTLMDAFKLEYLDFPPTSKPMDVVVIAGYENLLAGHSREHIVDLFQQFAHMVRSRGPHTFAIGSLMYPPRLAWLVDDGPLPSPDYVNMREKIDWINGEIARINEANQAVNPPRFHTYGIRTSSTPGFNWFGRPILVRRKCHRWDHWVGVDRAQMMHLRPEKLFKMGSALNNYFRYNT